MSDQEILPANTTFSIQNENTPRWDIRKPMDAIAGGETNFASVIVMLMPATVAQGVPRDLFYAMNQNEYVRKVEVMSLAQAYTQVSEGHFYVYNNMKKGDRLRVEKYELAYTYDSKGYYQPVYRFIGTVNGEQWETLVPAMLNG